MTQWKCDTPCEIQRTTEVPYEAVPPIVAIPSMHPTFSQLIAVESSHAISDDGSKWITTTTYKNIATIRKEGESSILPCVLSETLDKPQWISSLALVGILTVLCFVAFGCASGKTATGGVVVGFDVAALPETAGEAVGAAAEFLPEPWKSITLAGVTLLGGGGLLGYAKKKGEAQGWDERESHQAKIDATYDLGRTEAK